MYFENHRRTWHSGYEKESGADAERHINGFVKTIY